MIAILITILRFSKIQLSKVSDYLMDLSKVLFIAAVIDFFILELKY